MSLKKAKCRRRHRPYGLNCKVFQTEKALDRFNVEKGEAQATENAARKERHTKPPQHQGTAFLYALRRKPLSPTNVRKNSSPVRQFPASTAARPHLCRWPSAPRCLIRPPLPPLPLMQRWRGREGDPGRPQGGRSARAGADITRPERPGRSAPTPQATRGGRGTVQ